MTLKGSFIVLCGIDGAGKSTQEAILAQRYAEAGASVFVTKNPTETYRSNPLVRAYLDSGQRSVSMDALALMAAADRITQLETEIIPMLNEGKNVICNRYIYSTYAYFEARGADCDFVRAINSKVMSPDKAVLLTIDPREALKRIQQRDNGRAKFEERSAEYLGQIQNALVRHFPSDGLILDGEENQQVIADRIWQYVR